MSAGEAVSIFAVKDGLPTGGRLEAAQIMRLMRETRRATWSPARGRLARRIRVTDSAGHFPRKRATQSFSPAVPACRAPRTSHRDEHEVLEARHTTERRLTSAEYQMQ